MELLICKDNVVNMAAAIARTVSSFELAGRLTLAQLTEKIKPIIKFHQAHEGCYVWKFPMIFSTEYTFEKVHFLGPDPKYVAFAIDKDTETRKPVLDIWNDDLKRLLCEDRGDMYLHVRKFNEKEWDDFIHRVFDYIYSYNHSDDK